MGQLVYCYIGSPRNMESSAHERNLKIHANAPSLATQKQGKSFPQQCCSQFYESLILHYLHGSLRRRYDKVREFESRKTVTSSIKQNVGGFQFIMAIQEWASWRLGYHSGKFSAERWDSWGSYQEVPFPYTKKGQLFPFLTIPNHVPYYKLCISCPTLL